VAAVAVVATALLTGPVAWATPESPSTKVVTGCTIVIHPSAGNRTDCVSARMPGVDLSGMNLAGALLSGADLKGVNLSSANLSGANLNQANLSGANLTDAELFGAKLEDPTLTGVVWADTICVDGINSRDNGGTCKDHLTSAPNPDTIGISAPIGIGPGASISLTGFDPWPPAVLGAVLLLAGTALCVAARCLRRGLRISYTGRN
jgi:hypothetical protein